MDISNRLKTIANMVDKCECMADIGTDHGYLPIYLIDEKICKTAIASDINKGPVEKAKKNIKFFHKSNSIQCRLGPGLTTIIPGEADCAVIAGMGGNLIRDILEESIEVFKKLNYVILQPVQNPEVLREYILKNGHNILDEELCKDENKYYEIIKVSYHKGKNNKNIDAIYCEISEKLLQKKHYLLKDYIFFKIEKYDKILSSIIDNSRLAMNRKNEIKTKIVKLKELLKCL
ncbi:tRNA (adenine(22)-N(1))-methyltransferase [Clostridium pasteurianum DSM 525 = ATCC 6013]|uniref:tRNA (Adenine(22)-N(1))-methyltransferase n=1 Tax=Clostridium pasteurianum DSM 525 = ATCC 6013 TaxID=1262449 RepID=A0A0H3J5A7_CLOPA|nr:class I SAM-dependent methyltransferase [Clostridium pasteurianum]AJA48357.1 tRNA (adenine(22)-N(1))-methyltransferase [Clostridium pasteurianum DSM 525 = ATCC 6013]AJA52345.1 tRNA (adenine(22)-N(1))-methyltransferase [Clostridium pasteurianum DSM 525 = ATCC 6013]AOZ75603.1 SAM-dependent methyltransferase [Clostridium pasteurianum DSM 525 = ATCC 6013]AOZ79399.1 SAM-dependent methyltransferase [Clostridium pasteurianum]ELP60493.1 hypothetical protein F502_03372 [Clostridium pasteurianum DSM 